LSFERQVFNNHTIYHVFMSTRETLKIGFSGPLGEIPSNAIVSVHLDEDPRTYRVMHVGDNKTPGLLMMVLPDGKTVLSEDGMPVGRIIPHSSEVLIVGFIEQTPGIINQS
jgi:hypothetical protein